MTAMKITRPLTVAGTLTAATAAAALLAVGCSSRTTETTGTSPSVVAGSVRGPVGPITDIRTNNPPPGQPNHMSPEMQAQIERYRALGSRNNAGSTGGKQ